MKPPIRDHYENEDLEDIIPGYRKWALTQKALDAQMKDNSPRYCEHMMPIVEAFRANDMIRVSHDTFIECMECMVYCVFSEVGWRDFSSESEMFKRESERI